MRKCRYRKNDMDRKGGREGREGGREARRIWRHVRKNDVDEMN